MVTKRIVTDLADHASTQISAVLDRTADLLDDPGARNLYYMTLFGRFLGLIARELDEERTSETTPEQMLTATMVLLKVMYEPGERQDLPPPEVLQRKAARLWKRLVADHARVPS